MVLVVFMGFANQRSHHVKEHRVAVPARAGPLEGLAGITRSRTSVITILMGAVFKTQMVGLWHWLYSFGFPT